MEKLYLGVDLHKGSCWVTASADQARPAGFEGAGGIAADGVSGRGVDCAEAGAGGAATAEAGAAGRATQGAGPGDPQTLEGLPGGSGAEAGSHRVLPLAAGPAHGEEVAARGKSSGVHLRWRMVKVTALNV